MNTETNTGLNAANVNQPRELAHIPKTTRNGVPVELLNLESTMRILAGMTKITPAMADGTPYKGFKVTGNGTPIPATISANGKVVPASVIYNINAVSSVAENSPKFQQALLAAADAEESGDAEKLHDACRELMNSVTVSFNARSASFTKGQLVQGQVQLVTTERGSLLKLVNVSAMPAVAVPKGGEGFDLRAQIAALRAGKVETPAAETNPAATGAFDNAAQA